MKNNNEIEAKRFCFMQQKKKRTKKDAAEEDDCSTTTATATTHNEMSSIASNKSKMQVNELETENLRGKKRIGEELEDGPTTTKNENSKRASGHSIINSCEKETKYGRCAF